MKKILLLFFLIPFLGYVTISCSDDDKTTWEEYETWRNENETWLNQMARLETDEGKAYYERIVPEWNPAVYILMHYHNDKALTAGNYVPMETSTVRVKYSGRLYNATEPFDSSYSNRSTILGDSIFETKVTGVIQGWQIALQNMHVGDSVTVLIPYNVGYGANTTIADIPPYSALKFDIKLVDIPYYEVKP